MARATLWELPSKTKAREFYEKGKLKQNEGRFFPDRYQHGRYELVEVVIDRYVIGVPLLITSS